MDIKDKIIFTLKEKEFEIKKEISKLADKKSLTDYAHLCKSAVADGEKVEIWTLALQTALNENQVVYIPASDKKYYIDNTVVIPSNRRIEASLDACICLTKATDVLMFRNENTKDGTKENIKNGNEDKNISINGGIWQESQIKRQGYGLSGKYDKDRSFYGVSACMFFDNIKNLSLTNMTFKNMAAFGVQAGNIDGAVFESINFQSCYADGLHINGNTKNLIIRNISGEVGDDIVALNMYDWQDSSVNFGPVNTALVENVELSPESRYKAFRIQPGIYYYSNGTPVDCSANNLIIRNIKGINTFKVYYQTPAYKIGTAPENGDTGSGDNIFFEDIELDLNEPIDALPEYINSDSLRGAFAAFEIGANLENVYMSDIHFKPHRNKYPLSYLLLVGPKSCIADNDIEIFDPYINSKIDNLYLSNIQIIGDENADIEKYICINEFNNINNDGKSTAKGTIKNIRKEVSYEK